jgi:hypothetical protein
VGGSVAAVVLLVLVLAVISWRIGRIPRRIVTLIKNERAQKDGQAQAVILEAAALKCGPLIAGIRAYHDQITASYQAQIAGAEMRARLSESRASDATTYLSAASELVGELRALRDELAMLARGAAPPSPSRMPDPENDPEQRATVELRRSPPASGLQAVPSSTAGPPLPVGPAIVAARLGPQPQRPDLRPAPGQARTSSGALDARREPPAEHRRAKVDLGDSSDWMLEDRPSDADGERTRVGPAPTSESLKLPLSSMSARPAVVAKATLVSMKAVVPSASPPVVPVAIEGPSQGEGRPA